VGWSRDLGWVTVDEVAGVAKMAAQGMPPFDAEMLAAAVKTAKAGVEAMGGRAHVWVGGHDRESFDDETSGGKNPAQKSISVTITLHP
jgi:hypothetical protein